MRTSPVIATIVVLVALGACSGTAEEAKPTSTSERSRPPGSQAVPPDNDPAGAPTPPPAPADATAAATAAGVPMLDTEGGATHTHTRLKVTAAGAEMRVPAGLGIDNKTRRIGALHTHDGSGLVHVESPEAGDTYTLAQLLVLWGIEPTPAGVCAAFGLPGCEVRVDGTAVTEAAALEVVLVDAAEIHLELRRGVTA